MKANKLFIAGLIEMFFSINLFAATVYSPTNVLPLTSTYNVEKSSYCSVDSSAPLPSANYPTVKSDFSIGRYTFTADSTHGGANSSAAFTAWLKYWTTVYPALPSPLTLMASTLDPTSTAVPQAYLKETPVWWGTLSYGSSGSDLTYPFTGPTILKTGGSPLGLVFVTSYSYSNPANHGNVTTGYSFYPIDPASANNKGWGRNTAYLNKTPGPTNILTETVSTQALTLGATSYNFNCIGKLNLTQ